MAQAKFWKFLSEVRYEVKKVSWPNRKQLLSTTSAVVFVLLVSGAFLGLLDILFTNVIRNVLIAITGGI
ncbi:MAG: preprotein translocase subunit SecE [Thermotogae bacterium]|uniref:Protein translocase subunit SecE n=1 Tax=Kosmotoga arenicorallina TaxID=688066 RepID=A0A7C5HXX5_9BACT|nr:preprotein translocase subunit SecE [Kosmotoga sp.]MBO8167156.1 preprotein translocase subunit SecE [Kosmotoga sp.]MCD6160015.1 preprotein translocase subunit SecE [Kosmotoga sp.]RKX50059.1 MAG: preprotein translocase subunit SecE [Thermotogota bacterium]HHF08911.1 preprotein translocase subunit SecE [Kosmotoga arenicorallina]